MLQIEINEYYSTFPDDIALAILRTCACFSVTSVSRVASTAVWTNNIVALRIYMTSRGQGGAINDMCGKDK